LSGDDYAAEQAAAAAARCGVDPEVIKAAIREGEAAKAKGD